MNTTRKLTTRALLPLLSQHPLPSVRSPGARTSWRNGLSVARILLITGGIASMHAREYVIRSHQVAVRVHVELSLKHLGIGLMTNTEEQRAGWEIPDFPRLQIAQLQAGDLLFVDVVHIFDDGVQQ